MNIGLIGSGSIGQYVLKTINEQGKIPNARVLILLDEREDFIPLTKEVAEQYGCEFTSSREQFFDDHRLDMIVECAHPDTAKEYAKDAISHNKDMLIVSTGALTDENFLAELTELCLKHKRYVYVPSGAIGGLDAIASGMASGDVEEVSITTRKPPEALGMEITDGKAVTVFEGSAREAIAKFPQNVNVAITLSLSSLGVDQTKVLLVADPAVSRNIHEVRAKGAFGNVTVTLENLPMPTNPKTSYLAALSIISLLEKLAKPVKIGS